MIGAQQVHALVRILLDPHATAARAAAHPEVLVARHLDDFRAGAAENVARLVVHLVEAAVVAGVVVDGLLPELGRHLEPSLGDQAPDEIGGVDDLVAPVELRKLVLDRVEAVRAVHDDLLHLVAVERLDARLRHRLVEVLVAEAACGLAVAELFLAEAGEIDAGLLEEARESLGRFLVPVVEGAGAADVIEIFRVGLVGDRRHVHAGRPVEPLLRADAPRVRLRLHPLERPRELGGKARLLLHQVAPHVDDLVDVLDHHGTRLLARATDVAGPEHLVLDDGTDDVLSDLGGLGAVPVGAARDALGDHLVLVRIEIVPEVEQQLARRERLAGGRRRTLRGAAAALGAAEHVEDLLPVEVVDVRAAEARRVLEVLLGELADRLELAEEDVGQRRDDVEVLRARQQVQEDEHDEVVDPPGDVTDTGRDAGIRRREQPCDAARDRLPRALAHDAGIGRVDHEPAPVVEEPGQHDRRDEAEDDVCFPVRVAEEPALRGREAEEPRRARHEPAHERDGDPEEDRDLHQVAQNEVGPAEKRHAEAGQVEPVAVAAAEHRHDLEPEDREPPEDEEVHPAGARLAHLRHGGTHELLLAEEVDGDGLEPFHDAVEPVDGRGGAQQVEALPQLAHEDAERDDDAEGENHGREHDASA